MSAPFWVPMPQLGYSYSCPTAIYRILRRTDNPATAKSGVPKRFNGDVRGARLITCKTAQNGNCQPVEVVSWPKPLE